MFDHAYWILLLPLLSALTIFFFGRWLPLNGAILGILSIGYSALHSLAIFFRLLQNPQLVQNFSVPWFRFGIQQTEIGLLIDNLSALMLVVVTIVSFLVHIYSLGYMHEDPRFKRYYAYLSFFTFAMLFLVVANNFLQMFIGWELVGAASYLLIGFWFEKASAATAGRKAFITTKVADLGFFIAILMIFSLLGTLNFSQVQDRIIKDRLISEGLSTIIALLLFCGAMGKSAQVPFHVWLPDAMEGPTPVSALIHAATMVAAGVYMVARSYFIFQYGAFSLEVVAWVGGITAFLAATMALVANDIKRVLAFSTLSQLGYMMLAMGVGGRTAGMFHLTTHAFFKALLFLGAGSVIHAVHTNDIQEMGGLSKKMIWTFWTFLAAWVAICGIPPFAGFFSKDAILEAVYHSGHTQLFWIGVFVAFLTAFYMSRLFFLVFVKDPRNMQIFSHAHESPPSMVIPLVVLAVFALGSGLFFQYAFNIHAYLEPKQETVETSSVTKPQGETAAPAGLPTESAPAYSATAPQEAEIGQEHGAQASPMFVPVVSSVAAGLGIFLAYLFYWGKAFSAKRVAEAFRPIYTVLTNKYGFDEFYIYGIIKPADALSRALAKFDSQVLDRMGVDGVGYTALLLSRVQAWFDRVIIDNLVNLWGWTAQGASLVLKRLQTGLVQNYILLIVLGFGVLLFWRLNIGFGEILRLF